MDELPLLLNVLIGEMSLVGPRPPVRYEFEGYEIWHIDLRYARSWSLWLDLKILSETPRAVLSGAGAY